MLAPPVKLLGGPGPPWPPSSYAYDANVSTSFWQESASTEIEFSLYLIGFVRNITLKKTVKNNIMNKIVQNYRHF